MSCKNSIFFPFFLLLISITLFGNLTYASNSCGSDCRGTCYAHCEGNFDDAYMQPDGKVACVCDMFESEIPVLLTDQASANKMRSLIKKPTIAYDKSKNP